MPPSDPHDDVSKPDPNPEPEERNSGEEEELLDPEPASPAVPTGYRLELLERQYQSLETLFALAISALIILSLGVNWYLFKRTRLDRTAVYQQKIFVGNMQTEFDKRASIIREFIGSLEAYAKTDPEFRSVLDKYRNELGKYYTTSGSAPASQDE